MKILHVDTGRSFRGGQQQALLLMTGLHRRGATQFLLAPEESSLLSQAKAADVEGLALPRGITGPLHSVWIVRQVIRKFDPGVIHCHDARAHGLVRLAVSRPLLPVVVSRRVAFPISRNRFFQRKYGAGRQAFIAVSEYVRRLMIQSGIESSLVDVVYDAVDVNLNVDALSRQSLGLRDDCLVVGTFSALEAEKGLDLFIEALHRLSFGGGTLSAVMVGTGSKGSQLLKMIEERRLQETVRILSSVPAVPAFIKMLDLLVYPSRVEGLGSLLLLAMHVGTPVLASRVGGIPEVVQDETSGFLFESGNADDLCSKIEALIRSPQQRTSVVEAARARVREYFSVDRMVQGTLQSYEKASSLR